MAGSPWIRKGAIGSSTGINGTDIGFPPTHELSGKTEITVTADPYGIADFGPFTPGAQNHDGYGIWEALTFTNGPVKLLPGTYNITVQQYGSIYAGLSLNKNNIHLILENGVTINLIQNPNYPIATYQTQAVFYLSGVATNGIHVEGRGSALIQSFWNKSTMIDYNVYGVWSQNTANVEVHGIEFENVTIGVYLTSCTQVKVYNCTTLNGQASVNGFIYISACTEFSVYQNMGFNSGDDMLYIGDGACSRGLVSGNIFRKDQVGALLTGNCIDIYADTSGQNINDISIVNNFLVPNPETSIHAIMLNAEGDSTINNVTITGNTIDGLSLTTSGSGSYPDGICIFADSSVGSAGPSAVYGVSIVGNTIVNLGGPGVWLLANPSSSISCTVKFVTVRGNIFNNLNMANGSLNGALVAQGVGSGSSTLDDVLFAGNILVNGTYAIYAYLLNGSFSATGRLMFNNNDFRQISNYFSNTNGVIAFNNLGFNPQGAISPPSGPSTSPVGNNLPYPVDVYVSVGSTTTTISKNGTALGSGTSTLIHVSLDPGETITCSQTTSVSWNWFGM